MNWEKSSRPLLPPSGCAVKEKRTVALGLAEAPTEVNAPNVKPATVGGGVGSVRPELAVTCVKSYVAVKDCAMADAVASARLRARSGAGEGPNIFIKWIRVGGARLPPVGMNGKISAPSMILRCQM